MTRLVLFELFVTNLLLFEHQQKTARKARSTERMFVRPNTLRTLRRTMIRFLTELLVRRIWFGQSKLYFILNWLVMRCKLRPELAQTRCRQHDRKRRLKSSQYTLIIPHRIIQLTTISFWVSETRLRLPQVNK